MPSRALPSSIGEAVGRCFRLPRIELLVQRRVALTAKRVEGAQGPDVLEETEDERDEREDDRVDASDTIDSGDDADELERARDDRRTADGKPSNELLPLLGAKVILGGRWSRVDRAIPIFCA